MVTQTMGRCGRALVTQAAALRVEKTECNDPTVLVIAQLARILRDVSGVERGHHLARLKVLWRTG